MNRRPQTDSRRTGAPRVLIVEDEPAINRALQIALQRAGYETTATLSADGAMDCVRRERFDVMLIDLRLPDLRGDSLFLLAVSEQPHLRSSTIFLTGDISNRAFEAMQACGCRIVFKPFELQEVLNAVAEVTAHRHDATA